MDLGISQNLKKQELLLSIASAFSGGIKWAAQASIFRSDTVA